MVNILEYIYIHIYIYIEYFKIIELKTLFYSIFTIKLNY